jgi:phosphosulfolactate synthase (CoM biosynthesis protein A)
MNTTKNPNEKAFKFVKIFESPPKPRHLQDLLDMWGDYIDGFK